MKFIKPFLAIICAMFLFLGTTTIVSAKAVVKMLSIESNKPEEKPYYAGVEKAFEAAHPDIDVVIEYMDDESFKTKLPTLLQSNLKPDVFFSWGGGAFYEQAKAGVLEDITTEIRGDWEKSSSSAGIEAFSYEGKTYGAPLYAAQVVFWYNKKLTAQAGVEPQDIKTWDDFLSGVEKIKKAGITPIVVGGKDKWPLHFYYGYLATRIAGQEGITALQRGQGAGFMEPAFIRAGEEFKRLVELQPFQKGFMDTPYDKASGLFGDGKGAFHLMGDWDYGVQGSNSTSGKGLSDEELGIMSFPAVVGGKGSATDTFGGINGFLVTKNARKEAVQWLKFLLNPENQKKSGEIGLWIPVAKGADEGIQNPFNQIVSQNLAASNYHQLFLDQALGSSVGGTVNDMSADLAQGVVSPKEAAENLQEALEFQ